MPEKYIELNLKDGESYVRADRLSQLEKVDAIIFDCDGVLIDIRDSYNRAISKATAYIFEGLTAYAIPERLISDEVIFLFRRSGGFNNDRDTVYGILMFLLCGLPVNLRDKLKKRLEKAELGTDLFVRLSSVRERAKKEINPDDLSEEFFKGLIDNLKEFTELLDETGVNSVDKNLAESVSFYNALKRFLYYPAEVGESIVATVFEELFCGSELFLETYGIEPRFYKSSGMIKNERSIIQLKTLDNLSRILGKANLGIASGSKFKPAEYILGNLLDRFNPEALIFLDHLERAQRDYGVSLEKPNPFSLLKSAEALNPFNFTLYVGDSMADAMTAKEAKKTDPRFLFAGVYRYSHAEDVLLGDFLKYGCDVILPSVNELPLVLESIRRKEE